MRKNYIKYCSIVFILLPLLGLYLSLGAHPGPATRFTYFIAALLSPYYLVVWILKLFSLEELSEYLRDSPSTLLNMIPMLFGLIISALMGAGVGAFAYFLKIKIRGQESNLNL